MILLFSCNKIDRITVLFYWFTDQKCSVVTSILDELYRFLLVKILDYLEGEEGDGGECRKGFKKLIAWNNEMRGRIFSFWSPVNYLDKMEDRKKSKCLKYRLYKFKSFLSPLLVTWRAGLVCFLCARGFPLLSHSI